MFLFIIIFTQSLSFYYRRSLLPFHADFEPTFPCWLICVLEGGTFSVGVNPLYCLSGLSIYPNLSASAGKHV